MFQSAGRVHLEERFCAVVCGDTCTAGGKTGLIYLLEMMYALGWHLPNYHIISAATPAT